MDCHAEDGSSWSACGACAACLSSNNQICQRPRVAQTSDKEWLNSNYALIDPISETVKKAATAGAHLELRVRLREPNARSFCRECGTQKCEIHDYYHERTGQPVIKAICPNLKCREGCSAHGGHQTGWWNDICKRCGVYCGGPF